MGRRWTVKLKVVWLDYTDTNIMVNDRNIEYHSISHYTHKT